METKKRNLNKRHFKKKLKDNLSVDSIEDRFDSLFNKAINDLGLEPGKKNVNRFRTENNGIKGAREYVSKKKKMEFHHSDDLRTIVKALMMEFVSFKESTNKKLDIILSHIEK